VANVPTIDFHCIARTVISNYDVRFQVSQISTVGFNSDIAGGLNGEGRLTILGKEFFFTNSLSKVALRVGNDGTAQIGYQDLSVPGILNISGTATDAVSTASGKLCINGKQVLTHQRPFWDHASWPVEATSQITPLSTFGATYVQADLNTLLLQFKQLVAALKKHGILGTAANGTDVTQLTGLRT
jgi:hypothetical protein